MTMLLATEPGPVASSVGPAHDNRIAAVAPLRCERVSVSIGERSILENVSVDFSPGQITALVGPNGAGKSTLLSVLSGDRKPTCGMAWVGGSPVEQLAPLALARQRSVLPQHTNTVFSFSAADVVGMGRFPWETSSHEDATIAQTCLERVGITHLGTRSFPTLSGGEQALVNLARVLAQDAPVVLLDEPTAALDIGHQELVMRIASELADEGRTVILVVHDLNLAARYADRVLVLDAGRITADGSPSEALEAPLLSRLYRHPFVVLDHPFLRGRPLILAAPR